MFRFAQRQVCFRKHCPPLYRLHSNKTLFAAGSFCEALPAPKRNTKAFALVLLFGAGKRT